MLIAQITDTHVTPLGTELEPGLDTNAMLAAAVVRLNALDPAPDVVVVTGDLTESGAGEEYMALRELLAPLAMPAFLIPGNHDDRAVFLEAFADRPYLAGCDGFAHYAIEDHPVRLVALDTSQPGRPTGKLCEERLQWLDATLAAETDKPTFIFMHHPPFETHIWWMDAIGLYGREALAEIVARHPQVQRIVAGHVHRQIETVWAGVLASVAPATVHQVELDLKGDRFMEMRREPGCYQLHHYTGAGFVSHTGYVDADGFGPSFLPFGRPTEEERPAYLDWHDKHYRRLFGKERPQ